MQKYQPRIWIQEIPKQYQTICRPPNNACHNREVALQEERPNSEQSRQTWEIVHQSLVHPIESEQHSGAHGVPTKVEENERVGNLPDEVVQSLVDRSRARSVEFPETNFITVTAYQNQQVSGHSYPNSVGLTNSNRTPEVLEKKSKLPVITRYISLLPAFVAKINTVHQQSASLFSTSLHGYK